MPTPFSTLLNGATRSTTKSGALSLVVPEDWMQGRTVFGGLQIAVALRAMRALVPTTPLRTIQVTFFAPPGAELRVEARVIRTGKSTSHVEARVLDGEATAALVIGVFGAARTSQVSVIPAMPALDPTEARAGKLAFVPGVHPNFLQHFDVTWLRGGFPFSGVRTPDHVLDVSMNDDATMTEEHLLALADFVPPLGLTYLTAPAPGSTLTWMLELVGSFDGLPPRGFRVDVTLLAARDGYTSQSATIWSPRGDAVALSRQCMLVFA